ncbi:uncharacterized protein TNCV_91451 [Trichonephila clavipes]|nr:uncharacterized protein TNCV_91451 [Trichonephila clavipes]
MSLPNPVEQKSHDVINNKLSRVMKEVAEESMKMAAVEEYSSSPDILLTVSGDGTWKTRGHSSSIGVCTAIGAETGDDDTKTFNALSENKPYGDDYLIQKIECVGYVQKRMGTRLRKLILVYSKKKLSDGKTIGGKGRLTDSLIDKLAHYYGNAIRCNSTSVKEMRKAIWAVFGVILAALRMNRCTGFVLQIQIHGTAESAGPLYKTPGPYFVLPQEQKCQQQIIRVNDFPFPDLATKRLIYNPKAKTPMGIPDSKQMAQLSLVHQ